MEYLYHLIRKLQSNILKNPSKARSVPKNPPSDRKVDKWEVVQACNYLIELRKF